MFPGFNQKMNIFSARSHKKRKTKPVWWLNFQVTTTVIYCKFQDHPFLGLWDWGPLLSGLLQRLAHCPAVFFALFAFPQRGRCAIYDSRSHRDLRHRNRGVFDIPMGPCHLTPDPQNEGNRQLLSSYVVLRDVPFGNQTWQWEIPHTWRFWKNYLSTYLPTYLSVYLSSYPVLSCPILSIYLSTTFVYIYMCVCVSIATFDYRRAGGYNSLFAHEYTHTKGPYV